MENSSFEALTQDLQMEILSRLPLKSLGKFILVSKKWGSLIRSKEFRKRYLRHSKTRPRVLFINYPFGRDMLFHSVYQEEEPLLVSGQQQMRTSSPPLFKVSQPIRGLICLQEDTKVVLCNPGTKKLKTLPAIQAREGASIRSFFGYHEAEDVFKVLCITQFGEGDGSEVTKEYQVYTEGSGEDSWTQIECKHDHSPVTEGLCKGGFLYYGARSSDKSVIMRFDVGSEDFTVIELPDDVEIAHRWKLVNYNKEIALLNDSDFDFGIVNENGNGVFEMWVRNETAGNWSINCIEIPQWEEPVGNMEFFFKGTIGTGKLVFALDSVIEGSFFVLYYDTSTKNLRRFTIEGVAEDQLCEVRTFLDHVDSTWLM